MKISKFSHFKIWLIFIMLLVITIYVLLVLGCFVIKHYIYLNSKNTETTDVQKIVAARISQEDEAEAKMAFSEGYLPIVNPAYINSYSELKELAFHYGVAPLGAQPNTNIYYCNEGYGTVRYKTDRFGYRNDDVLWDQNIDLLLIGDSYAQGACVDQNKTISGNLLKRGYKTLNLGAGGSDPVIYASQIKVFAPQIKPKYLALIFYANDNNEGDQNSIFYRHYFIENNEYFQNINNKLSLNDKLEYYYRNLNILLLKMYEGHLSEATNNGILGRFKPYLLLKPIREQANIFIKQYFPRNSSEFSTRLAIDTLIKTCLDISCTPLVIYIPNSNYWDPDPRASIYSNFINSYSFLHNIKHYDASIDFQNIPDEKAYAIKGPHLSPEGYKRVSEGIVELLIKK